MTLDPTKGNVYCIQFQYLGYGDINYMIENPETGLFVPVHIIKYANTATVPTLVNPTLHLNLIAKTESGYSGGALTMKTASMAGFIEGIEAVHFGVRRGISATKTVTTTRQNMLTLHNEIDFNNKINKVGVYLDFLTFASESTKTVVFEIIYNPTRITGGTALTDIETTVSTMQYSSGGTTVIGGKELFPVTIEGLNSKEINLADLGIKLRPGDRITVTGVRSSGGADGEVVVGATWVERI